MGDLAQKLKFMKYFTFVRPVAGKKKNRSQSCGRNGIAVKAILTLALILTCSLNARAQKTATINGVTWSYTDVTNEVWLGNALGYNVVPRTTTGEITVPEEIDGKPVTMIWGEAFYLCSNVTKITFPKAIKVGSYAGFLFSQCTGLQEIEGLENLDMSECQNADKMFYGCTNLSQNTFNKLASWNVSNVKIAQWMLAALHQVTDLSAISGWDVSSMTNMAEMFNSVGMSTLSPLANWDISSATTIEGMFCECTNLTDINALRGWVTSNVQDFSGVFKGCTSLTNLTPLATWNTSNGQIFQQMFAECTALTSLDGIGNFDLSNATGYFGMAEDRSDAMSTIIGNTNSNKIGMPNECLGGMWDMFAGCTQLRDISALANWNTGNVLSMYGAFRDCSQLSDISPLASWDVSSLRYMTELFEDCSNITDLTPLESWNTGNVTHMQDAFSGTMPTNIHAIRNWNVSSCQTFKSTFESCRNLELADISNWTTRSDAVTTEMFYNCTNMWRVKLPPHYCYSDSEDRLTSLAGVDMSSVQYGLQKIGDEMFGMCGALEEITLPSGLTSIGERAFYGTTFKDITIPAYVTSIGSEALYITECKNFYFLPETPPEYGSSCISPTYEDYSGWSVETGRTKIYVKPSAVSAYERAYGWSDFDITDKIPFTIPAGKVYSTFAYDFDADFSQSDGLKPILTIDYQSFRNGNTVTKNVSCDYFPDYYIPSRTGDDSFNFYGGIVYGKSGTYYFQIGEQDYTTYGQIGEDWSINYMQPAYESWTLSGQYEGQAEEWNWTVFPKEDTFNYVLKDGRFKYIDNTNKIARHKAWLELPKHIAPDGYDDEANAKINLVFTDDETGETNSIEFVQDAVDNGNETMYNLAGQKVGKGYKGVAISKGKVFISK